MKRYRVNIQLLEVWHVEVEAVSEAAAEAIAYGLSARFIEQHGDLQHTEIDHAKTIDEVSA